MFRRDNLKPFLSKALTPSRVFIALMIAVLAWLFPFVTTGPRPSPRGIENGLVLPMESFEAGARGPCSNVWCEPGFCCSQGYCVTQCGGDEDPIPPSISGWLSCLQWGNDGWCIDTLNLELSASDSQGQTVQISGSINGLPFAAPLGATSWPIPITTDGTGTAIYTVTSINGSASGSLSYKLDATTPQIAGSLSGVPGLNNWYVSEVTVSASASDAASGLASFMVSIDGGLWTDYNEPITLTDGVHNLSVHAADLAGNTNQVDQQIKVDTILPEVKLTLAGTPGEAGWYISNISIAASATDLPALSEVEASGLASFEYSLDNGAWTAYTAPITLSDGIYSLSFRAADQAGNVTLLPARTYYVDTTPPAIDMTRSARVGDTVGYGVHDGGSGQSAIRVIVEDEDERWPQVAFDESASGTYQTGDFTWDGLFRDGTKAPAGTYYGTVRAFDMAGNEGRWTAKIRVVEEHGPVFFGPVDEAESTPETPPLPLEGTNPSPQTVSVLPPVETVTVGGEGNQVQLSNSVSASFGAASTSKVNTTDASNILWGAAASAAVAAFLAEVAEQRKRREEEKDDSYVSYAERGQRYQAARNNFNAALKQAQAMGMTAVQVKALQDEIKSSGKIGASLAVAQEYVVEAEEAKKAQAASFVAWREAERQDMLSRAAKEKEAEEARHAQVDMTDEERLEVYKQTPEYQARQEAQSQWLAEEAAKAQAASFVAWREAERMDMLATAEKEDAIAPSFTLLQWWEDTKSFVSENILQSINTNVYQTYIEPTLEKGIDATQDAGAWLDENLYEPYIKPVIEKAQESQVYKTIQSALQPKNLVPALVTVVLGADTLQWINNVTSHPDSFLSAQTYAQSLIEQVQAEHPRTPEDTSWSYMLTHPYQVMDTGLAYFNALTTISGVYADTIWQQNPVVKMQIQTLEGLETRTCSQISSQSWSNRCTAAFYLPAGLTATPFDTTFGVIDTWVVNPVAGVLKQVAVIVENYEAIPDLVKAVQEGGLQAGKDFVIDLFKKELQFVLNDSQIQAALMFESLILLALAAAPVTAGVILGTTVKGLIDLDIAVATAKTKQSLIDFVTSHNVRTTVVSSGLIMAMLFIPLGKKALDFRAIQEGMSPSAQANFQSLSLLEQTRLADLAIRMKLSPGALEFYINESARFGSPLTNLSLSEAYRVSSLAEQTGKGAFLMDYVARYGYTDALKIASPEVIKGMTNDQFLVQAQDILSKNTGYNVTPESVFTNYPGSTIGKNVTFITNEAAIRNIIGDFHGTKTIYVSFDQAIALENALGLKTGTLVDGFRISKISNLDSLGLSYPLEGDPLLFRGPGQGLPGGGTEMIIDPPVPMNSLNVVDQITIKVYP